MLLFISSTSIVMAIVSFYIFASGSFKVIKAVAQTADASEKISNAANNPAFVGPNAIPSVQDLTALINALDAAFSSFVKAGPALAGLCASILFIGIAVWAVTPKDAAVGDVKLKCSIAKSTPISLESGLAAKDIPVTCAKQ